MDLGIAEKLVVITGSGRGLGSAMALSLAKEGARVAIISRTASDLHALLLEMSDNEGGNKGNKNGKHYSIACDLTEEGMPAKAVKELQEHFGQPDIIINNLGGTLDIKDPFCSLHEWRKIWRMNLEVAIELNNLLIPHMKQQQWGRIVNISSISALENQGPVPYCSIKAALNAYSRSMEI